MKKAFLAIMLVFSTASMAQQDEIIWDIFGAKLGESFEMTKANIQKYFEGIEEQRIAELPETLREFARTNSGRGSDIPTPFIFKTDNIYYQRPRLLKSKDRFFTLYGVVFDDIRFSFTTRGNGSYLHIVTFTIECDSKKEAAKKLKDTIEILKKRFIIYEGKDQDGNEIYGGGSYYKDDGKCAFLVDINTIDKKKVELVFREGGW